MSQLLDFILGLSVKDVPEAVRHRARMCLLDLAGVAVCGRETPVSRIVHDFVAAHQLGGKHGARLIFDGRRVSLPGAAMAGAATIDSYDAHDGHRLTKGHAGVVVLPALLAVEDEMGPSRDGAEFFARLVMGYEVAVRAGIALHATAPDYHTSGAWNALAAAAVVCRALDADRATLREALGTAEFYGPRSQMMRCIDWPTMVKDGSTYGGQVGVSAALLALGGFTGAPAITTEAPEVASYWSDLGTRWRITEQYFKPWPICRWAQPAVAAAQALRAQAAGRAIEKVRIRTFHAAARLDVREPNDTDAAQYALPFPVAAMLAHGVVDGATVTTGLKDPATLAMARRIDTATDPELDAKFPARRIAVVEVDLADGTRLVSPPTEARGDPEDPLSDAELYAKAEAALVPRVGAKRWAAIRAEIEAIETRPSARPLVELLLAAP
ncbi:MAG: MmgE/PrpD family protein [Alphaproteobacteria bacterium]|nr:MmgE/PrpD family protein [Alphaproteobacteria bacterium]